MPGQGCRIREAVRRGSGTDAACTGAEEGMFMQVKTRSAVSSYLGLLLVFVLWGSLYVVSKALLGSLPTFFVAFVRYLVAYGLFLAMYAVRRCAGKRNPGKGSSGAAPLDPAAKKYIRLMGILGYAVSVGLQLLGTKLTGASAASLINATNPIAITIMAALLLKEKLTKNKVIGIVLAIAGVYLIIGVGSHLNPLGIVCSVCSVLGWAFSSVMVRKKLSGVDPLVVTRRATGIALLCNLVLCAGEMLLTGAAIGLNAKRPRPPATA